MISRMCLFIVVLNLPIISFCAAGTPLSKVPFQNLPLFTGNESPTANRPELIIPRPQNPINTDDYIGEVDTVGTTYCDVQHNGSCGRMIRVDFAGFIHVVWMNSLSGGINRHIYYNLKLGLVWCMNGTVGVAVENQTRAGYVTLAVDGNSYPFPAFHVITPFSPNGQPHSAVTTDYIPGAGAFFPPWELPYVIHGDTTLQVIWPKIAIDRQGRFHIVSTECPQSGIAGTPMRVYYCRGTYDYGNQIITYINQIEVGWTEVIASDIAASRVSDRVAFTYHAIGQDSNQYCNDICLLESEDGVTWDFQHPTNITQFIPPDTTLLPDTLAAMRDSLRAYADASILFDYQDNIHVAFTTRYYDGIRGYIQHCNSLIWHWSEVTNYYSLAARWWSNSLFYQMSAWQLMVQHPCLAEDENTGDLFMVYQEYDTSDVSGGDYPQGEIIVSRSTTGGTYWSVGTDVTNTHSPGAVDTCWDERDATCNETVEYGNLHLLYVVVRGAYEIEPQTRNDVYYQRVPIDQIPSAPLMPVYPLHCDSTGMPPSLAVEIAGNEKIPSTFHLSQNYPNPFNSITMIDFDINHTDHLTLKVYNILGQEVATLVNGDLSAGTYRVSFDASSLSSGIYFYRLSSSVYSQTCKMLLLK
jgi:hypothetical protein